MYFLIALVSLFCFQFHFSFATKQIVFSGIFFRMKKFLWKIIGVFQLPTYESPINSNPAAEAINPYFCTLAKLC